jgi:hypothetical protein
MVTSNGKLILGERLTSIPSYGNFNSSTGKLMSFFVIVSSVCAGSACIMFFHLKFFTDKYLMPNMV